MRNKRFIVSVTILSILIFSVSVTWAGKPPTVQKIYGYAMINDSNSVIKSDSKEQYIDRNNGGADQVEIIYKDGIPYMFDLYFGKIKYPDPPTPSDRRVLFNFDIAGTPLMPTHTAVYDILLKWKEGSAYYNRSLNDYSVHLPVRIVPSNPTENYVQFAIDPDYDGTNAKAITQAKVDAFYSDDVNVDYWDTKMYGEYGHIIYSLDYVSQFYISPIDANSDGKPETWIFTAPNPDSRIKLFMKKAVNRRLTRVDIAEYDTIPFQFAVSLNPITSWPSSIAAPKKHSTISTTWGDVRTAKK